MHYVSQVIQTELAFMAQHPVAISVAAVVLGLLVFTGYLAGAR